MMNEVTGSSEPFAITMPRLCFPWLIMFLTLPTRELGDYDHNKVNNGSFTITPTRVKHEGKQIQYKKWFRKLNNPISYNVPLHESS